MAGVTPKDIWDELEAQGASSVQAAGIMGNWIAESSLDPESKAMDSNGYYSYGLAQWNAASYPQASTLVTGNPGKDLKAQIKFLAQTGGFKAASGNTPTQVAGNFAKNYERCSSCQPGGISSNQREGLASQVAGWASGGNWPESSGSATDSASLNQAAAQQSKDSCAWGINLDPLPSWVPFVGGPGTVCIVAKTQLRALLSGGILVGGTVIALFGIALLFSTTSIGKAAARTATSVLAVVPK